MRKTVFEQMGGTYARVGDYLLPNIVLPEEEQLPIGHWGKRHLKYIKQYLPSLYTELIMTGKLNNYLVDIDEESEEMFSRLVKQMAEKQGVTEQLKAENQMIWVQKMNNIRNQVNEIINHQLIYV